ncbi:MAG TPA: hypothetical protein VMF30_01335, partial [Pirellulales bacterium]|nr:hypothetical protein [Pirellulales bacterium]
KRLRGASDSLKGIGIQSAYRSAGLGDGGYYGRYDNYGGFFGETSDAAQRRAIETQEKTTGATKALGQFRNIEEATSATRRAMTERYKVEF